MTVVTDASPLHYPILIGHAEALGVLHREVVVPRAVMVELSRSDTPPTVRDWMRAAPGWMSASGDPVPTTHRLPGSLHMGESEAIELALQRHVPVVLLDDQAARRVAARLGPVAVGTFRVLAEAAKQGLLVLPDAYARPQQTNFRASRALYDALLRRAQAESDHPGEREP